MSVLHIVLEHVCVYMDSVFAYSVCVYVCMCVHVCVYVCVCVCMCVCIGK